jgi:prevent-host-death family protein
MADMATVSIRELGRQVSGVVNEVRTTGRPTFVTHRGTPVAVLLPLDADELEDYVLANAPEYVASMRRADEAIEQGESDLPLADAIAEFESEHGPLDDAS